MSRCVLVTYLFYVQGIFLGQITMHANRCSHPRWQTYIYLPNLITAVNDWIPATLGGERNPLVANFSSWKFLDDNHSDVSESMIDV